jgi:hypothetical protein
VQLGVLDVLDVLDVLNVLDVLDVLNVLDGLDTTVHTLIPSFWLTPAFFDNANGSLLTDFVVAAVVAAAVAAAVVAAAVVVWLLLWLLLPAEIKGRGLPDEIANSFLGTDAAFEWVVVGNGGQQRTRPNGTWHFRNHRRAMERVPVAHPAPDVWFVVLCAASTHVDLHHAQPTQPRQ